MELWLSYTNPSVCGVDFISSCYYMDMDKISTFVY